MDRVVFINYRGEDSHSYGALLYRDLIGRFGRDLVFLDAESTPAGADFVEELLDRVRSARLLLAVIGPRWLTATDPATGRRRIDDPADWVRRELAEAFAAGVRVIPVLIDQADLPAAADLPADIATLSRCQYRHLRRREPTVDLARIASDLISLDPALAAALGPPVSVPPRGPRQLPTDTAVFTGRGLELERLLALADQAEAKGLPGTVAITAIDGMGGIGKTALAVHAAHVLRDRFPDRQLFIDLHAHTPGRELVRPEDALAVLLAAAGANIQDLPDGLDGRAAMWRDKMAGQHALVVLDNAASTKQVAPLLPGDGTCLVLVTSRRHLGDLPGAVAHVPLDVLPPRQAAEMFTQMAPRAADSPDEVMEVVRLAGFLPLAISLLARLFVRHRSWTLADLAAETKANMLTLTAEHESVAAAFEVSYRHLNPVRQRFFGLLGLHPGTTCEAYAAAALAGTTLDEAAELLESLHGEGLLVETGHRQYGMHDLLRRYARDRAAGLAGSRQAVERLLDYYQHTSARADALIGPYPQPGPPPAAPAGQPAVPDLEDFDQALAWARADRANLLACLDEATHASQDARVVALTAGVAGLLRRDGPWADVVTRQTAAAQAAHRVGDRLGEANALTQLDD